ncbi:hypothetical protein [Winogradskyella sp.]|uniref:hypothetical protein n=1 Tax=Winogradskyella sp. TaxID=1883156 RepID=UPI003AB8B2D6
MMFKLIKKILFNSVLVVILLHTFIPHPHSDEMTDKAHITLHRNSNTLFDIITIAFHESNDKDLDNLIFAQHNIVTKNLIKHQYSSITTNYGNFSIIENKIVGKIIQRNIFNPNKLFIVKLNEVRGPPFMA